MRYFHRTSLALDEVLEEANRHFGGLLAATESGDRSRIFAGTIGTILVHARAEGGHYTLVTVETDQVGESEADKLAKRFLTVIHKRVEPTHVVRGSY